MSWKNPGNPLVQGIFSIQPLQGYEVTDPHRIPYQAGITMHTVINCRCHKAASGFNCTVLYHRSAEVVHIYRIQILDILGHSIGHILLIIPFSEL